METTRGTSVSVRLNFEVFAIVLVDNNQLDRPGSASLVELDEYDEDECPLLANITYFVDKRLLCCQTK